MLNYPDDFNIPVFPAGKRIALARIVSVGILIAALIIVFLCFLLVWATKSVQVSPYLVDINSVTGEWSIIEHSNKDDKYTVIDSMRQSVMTNFIKHWFNISVQEELNENNWQSCDREFECNTDNTLNMLDKKCSVFCLTNDTLFDSFETNIVPEYKKEVIRGNIQYVKMNTIDITALDTTKQWWQAKMQVVSALDGEYSVVAFINVQQDTDKYPQTLGFYINDFYSYGLKDE